MFIVFYGCVRRVSCLRSAGVLDSLLVKSAKWPCTWPFGMSCCRALLLNNHLANHLTPLLFSSHHYFSLLFSSPIPIVINATFFTFHCSFIILSSLHIIFRQHSVRYILFFVNVFCFPFIINSPLPLHHHLKRTLLWSILLPVGEALIAVNLIVLWYLLSVYYDLLWWMFRSGSTAIILVTNNLRVLFRDFFFGWLIMVKCLLGVSLTISDFVSVLFAASVSYLAHNSILYAVRCWYEFIYWRWIVAVVVLLSVLLKIFYVLFYRII